MFLLDLLLLSVAVSDRGGVGGGRDRPHVSLLVLAQVLLLQSQLLHLLKLLNLMQLLLQLLGLLQQLLLS